MDGRKGFFLIILFILLSTLVFAQESYENDISPSTRAYFDNQNQKVIAQLSAKIDQSITKVETDLDNSVKTMQEQVKKDVESLIGGMIRAVAIGLGGIVIVTLAVFKVIDLKLTSTKNLKKYEDMLKKQTLELNKIVTDNKREAIQLKHYKRQLMDWQQKLKLFEQNLILKQGTQPQQPTQFEQNVMGFPPQQYTSPPGIMPPPPKTFPKEKKKFSWKRLLIGILIIAILIALGGIYYKFVIA